MQRPGTFSVKEAAPRRLPLPLLLLLLVLVLLLLLLQLLLLLLLVLVRRVLGGVLLDHVGAGARRLALQRELLEVAPPRRWRNREGRSIKEEKTS